MNADDFGMNKVETEAICNALADGRISSATVMATGVALKQAAACIRHFPDCSFGAHLNLTHGVPVSRGGGAKLLLDRDGKMSRRRFAALRPTPAVLRAVYEEWCAQLELLGSHGICVSHLDSHNHTHTVPYLFPVLKAVQRKFAIRKVRISKNVYSPSDKCEPRLNLKKQLFNAALRSLYYTRTTEAFTDLCTFYEVAKKGPLPHRTIEVMVHPKSRGGESEDALLHSDWQHDLSVHVVRLNYNHL